MANGNGCCGRQRQTDKQYVKRYIDGSYSEDEQCVGGTQTGGGTVVEEQYVRQVVHRHIDGTCTLTSGSRAARGRAEPFRRAIHRAVIDGTYTDERYASNTGTGATSRSSTLSAAHQAA